nr:zinc finger protein RFP-like isoform X2 [Caretta caretta]
MAAASPVESLQEEATCPICLEYFTDPVTLECGHNFCRACIAQCWEGPDTAASCPQCRETVQQRNLRPNRQLANILEIAKRLSFQTVKGAGGGEVCGEHQEALKLFCEEDQTPICVVCDRSRAHRTHMVVPIQEAAQEYKEKIQAHLKTLREEREKMLGLKVTGEKRSQEYLKQTETERQKIVSEFQQLRELLEEQERLLVAQLEKLDKEIVKIQNENITKLSEGISRLSELISEMEGKCQKPASEFLQDVRSTLSRCEKGKFQQPEEISPELGERVSDFSQKTIVLTETLRKFKDTLPSALESLGAHRQDLVRCHRIEERGTQSSEPQDPQIIQASGTGTELTLHTPACLNAPSPRTPRQGESPLVSAEFPPEARSGCEAFGSVFTRQQTAACGVTCERWGERSPSTPGQPGRRSEPVYTGALQRSNLLHLGWGVCDF